MNLAKNSSALLAINVYILQMHLWEPFLWVASWLPSLAPTIIRNSVTHGRIFHPEYTQVGNSFEILTYPLYVPRNKQVWLSY